MYIQAEYIDGKNDFDNFYEVKKYYNREDRNDILDIDDLDEDLREEYNGMQYPKLTLKEKYEVERSLDYNYIRTYTDYFDTIEEAKNFFDKIVEEQRNEELKECDDFECYKFINLFEYDPCDSMNFEENKKLYIACQSNNYKIEKC